MTLRRSLWSSIVSPSSRSDNSYVVLPEALSKLTSTAREDSARGWDFAASASHDARLRLGGGGSHKALSFIVNAQAFFLCAERHRVSSLESRKLPRARRSGIRLLSGKHTIVWVHLQGGHCMKTLQDWLWRLPARVRGWLEDLYPRGAAPFAGRDIYVLLIAPRDITVLLVGRQLLVRTFQYACRPQLTVPITVAEYLHDYSTFGDVSRGSETRLSVLQFQAVGHDQTKVLVPRHPLAGPERRGQRACMDLHSYALTSVAFHVDVLQGREITRHI